MYLIFHVAMKINRSIVLFSVLNKYQLNRVCSSSGDKRDHVRCATNYMWLPRRTFEKLGLHSSSHHEKLLVVIRIHCMTAIFLIVNGIFKEQFFQITTIIEFLVHWVSLSYNFKGYSMYLNFLTLNVNDRIFLLKIFILLDVSRSSF